jgi:microcystin-dependent protein
MSINFPNSPSDQDVHESFVYSGNDSSWNAPKIDSVNDFGNVLINSPQNMSPLVFSEDSSTWINGAQAVYPGQIFAYVGSTAPAGYLLCDGSIVSRSEYSDLFSVIGTTYNGGGVSQSDFRLPLFGGRVPVGISTSEVGFDILGKSGGEKDVTLTTNQIPSHTHEQLSHNHFQDPHNHTQVSHSHSVNQQFYPSGWEAGGFGLGFFGSFRGRTIVQGGTNYGTDGRTPGIQNATATNQDTVAVNQNTGGGQPHNNLQPYVVVQYIIKT